MLIAEKKSHPFLQKDGLKYIEQILYSITTLLVAEPLSVDTSSV